MDSAPLFMLRAVLDRARLFQFGRATGLPLQQVDTGYLVHAALCALFGDNAPQPFALQPGRGRQVPVLAYTTRPESDLRTHALSFADPLACATCDLDGLASKPMPDQWPLSHTLGFEVRVCPVVRKSSAGPKHRKGAEVDVFLARCWAAGDGVPVDREVTYRDWLTEQLGRHGARVHTAQLVRFQRERLARRDHQPARRWTRCERPDAALRGTLEVTDAMSFRALLRRGVGRHRAFGFGMLLLKPPGEE